MEKKLVSVVLVGVGLLLGLAMLFPAKKKTYDVEIASFEAQNNTSIYFKNVRAFYYGLEDLPDAGLSVYRFGETTKSDTGIYLNFIIVHNWRASEVYIATEPSKAMLALGETDIAVGDKTLRFEKSSMNNEAQYHFAASIFMALLENKAVTLANTNKSIFGNLGNEDANFTVLKDYFKWLYKYR